jgi:hypothetical protein
MAVRPTVSALSVRSLWDRERLKLSSVSTYETYVDGLMASTFFALNGFGRLRSCWNRRPRFPWLPIDRKVSGDRNDGGG